MHDTVIIEVNGKKREVDTEIASLILELHRVGLKTTNSCQGTSNNYAYLSIQLGKTSRFDYYAEKNILTIRWDRSGKDHIPVESNIIASGSRGRENPCPSGRG